MTDNPTATELLQEYVDRFGWVSEHDDYQQKVQAYLDAQKDRVPIIEDLDDTYVIFELVRKEITEAVWEGNPALQPQDVVEMIVLLRDVQTIDRARIIVENLIDPRIEREEE